MNINRISAFSYENSGGNPAGILINNKMLNEKEMLEIAKEVNYSETAFLVKKTNKKFRIKYFSPEMEIAFCGHATIASGFVLAKEFGFGKYELELNTGLISIDTENINGEIVTSINSLTTRTEDLDDGIIDSFLELFNFSKSDLDLKYPIKNAFSGNYHLIIFVKDKKTLENMEYDFEKAKALSRKYNITTISLLYRESENLFHSRNLFAYGGVYEDPATGSAGIALAEYLRDTKIKTFGNIEILQGFDMGVPCKLYVEYSNIPHSSIKISGQSIIIKENK